MCSFWVFIFPAHFFPIILPRLFFRAKSTTLRGREGGSDARSTPRFGTVAFCVLLLGTEKAFDDIEETPARTHTSEEEPRAEKILNHQDEKRRVVVCLYFLFARRETNIVETRDPFSFVFAFFRAEECECSLPSFTCRRDGIRFPVGKKSARRQCQQEQLEC